MKKQTLFFLFFFCLLFLHSPVGSAAEEPTRAVPADELFVKANSAWREGRFNYALDLYRRVRDAGFEGGDLFYNMGNCFYRIGKKGMAILNYERAMVMMPHDPDLRYNLALVRDELVDDTGNMQDGLHSLLFWLDRINVRDAILLFAAVNILFWCLVLCHVLIGREIVWYLLMFTLVIWCLTAVSAGVKWYDYHADDRGVVTVAEAGVFAGPSSEDTMLFMLHEGAMARREREEDGWSLVRIGDNRRGWISSENFKMIHAVFE